MARLAEMKLFRIAAHLPSIQSILNILIHDTLKLLIRSCSFYIITFTLGNFDKIFFVLASYKLPPQYKGENFIPRLREMCTLELFSGHKHFLADQIEKKMNNIRRQLLLDQRTQNSVAV